MRRLLALVLVCPALLLSQSDRGTITGRVLDPSSAAVPNASITATNQATGVKYSGSSNETGNYSLQQLPPGKYEVAVEVPGFRRYVHKDIDINVAQTLGLNVSLEVGEVNQAVEVSAAAAVLQTSSSDLGTTVSRERVMDLPLSVQGNIRNPESFIFLAPGVSGTSDNTQINGSQSRAKEVLLDGVGATSPESGGILFTYPSVEAIGEFKLVSGNFNPEYGRTGGGFEVFTTRSGTNEFHGSVFDYLRNDAFDARGFYAPTTPVNRQNEFGAAAGGPILKNRTFFHFVYDGFRYRQGALNALASIPPLDFRRGDFSRLVDRNGRPMQIYDSATTRADGAAFTRDPFPGNQIPQNRFSAVSAKMLPLLPSPTNSNLQNNFLTIGARIFDRDQIDGKVDHAFSDRNRLSVFTYIGRQKQIDPEGLPNPLSNALDRDRRSRWIRLTHDYIFSPATLNNFILGFTREGEFWKKLSADQDWPNKVGLRGVVTGKGNAFPQVKFADTSYSNWADEIKTVGSQVNNAWQVRDSLSHIRGNHSLKFGGEARWLQTNGADFFGSQGFFTFNSNETALPTAAGRTNSGSAFASLLLGAVDNAQMNVLAVVPGNRYRYAAWYAQDDWKAGRKLTLNYGLRYEIYFPRSERFGNMSGFDPTIPNPAAGNRLGAIAFLGEGSGRNGRKSFADTYYRNFGPRLGLALQLTDRTVLRAGYGIFYAPGNANAGLRASQSYGFGFNASPSPATTNAGVTPAFNWDEGFPQSFIRPPIIDPAVANDQNVNMIGRGDGKPPYFQDWTLGLQRELPGRMVIEAAYVGNKGTRLGTGLFNLNEVDPRYLALGDLLTRSVTSPEAQSAGIVVPYPGFNKSVAQALRPYPQYLGINDRAAPIGNSTYHSLQAKAEKRLSQGLTFLAAYTWSKAITDGNVMAGGGPAGQTFYNRRLEKAIGFDDVPHILNISYLYELPFGPGKRFLNQGGVAGKIAGGWTVTGIQQYSSGKPVVLQANNTLALGNGLLRPDVVAGVKRLAPFNDPARDRWINTAAFSVPAPLRFGTAARAYADLRMPASLNESFGAIKRTPITERVLLTFRAEFFNAFNRVVFSAPAANVSAQNFGRISGQANTPRQGQLALRLEF